MSGSSKRVPRASSRPRKPRKPAIQMIVRRGATPRFEALKRKTKHLNVEVVWDRREPDPSSQTPKSDADAAFRDRRGAPPFTWDLADFVVVMPKLKRRK